MWLVSLLRDVNAQTGVTSAQFVNTLSVACEWTARHLPTRTSRGRSLLSRQPLAFIPSTEEVPVALMGRNKEEKTFPKHKQDKG